MQHARFGLANVLHHHRDKSLLTDDSICGEIAGNKLGQKRLDVKADLKLLRARDRGSCDGVEPKFFVEERAGNIVRRGRGERRKENR